MTVALELIFLILVLAVLIYGGDGLLKLIPGNERLKQAARIIAIVAVSLLFLSMAASFLGVAMPFGIGGTSVRHHR